MDEFIDILTLINSILFIALGIIVFIYRSFLDKYIDKKVESIDFKNQLKQERMFFTKKYTQENFIQETLSLFDFYMGFINGDIIQGKFDMRIFNEKSNRYIPKYGSPKTVELFAEYRQYRFGTEDDIFVNTAYVTMLLSRLRFDFSREWVEPDVFLKINMSDYDKLDKRYHQRIKQLKKFSE